MEDTKRFVIGHHDPKRPLPVTIEAIQNAHAANYDMLTSPITTPHFQSRVLSLLSSSLAQQSEEDITRSKNASPVTIPPLIPEDTPLTPDESIGQVIGLTSSWIDLGSPDPIIADVSRQVLKLELEYAAFCGVTYILIPGPHLRGQGVTNSGVSQYARAILDAISQGPYVNLYVWMPMIDHSEEQIEQMGDLAPFSRQQYQLAEDTSTQRLDLFGTWEAWDMIRSICKYHSRLCVALSLPKLLPPTPIQSRWYSEPVRLLTLNSKIFSKNAKGYPVLSRAHQALITRFTHLRNTPWFLLCDVSPISPLPNGRNGMTTSTANFPSLSDAAVMHHIRDLTPHLSYMRNLETKQPPQTAFDRFGAGYQDYLQAPLQPLTVNLESITYEVFEKDPIKYAWYERAVARALHDWIEQGKPTSNPDGRVVVAVVGAGRGPLVTRALKASEDVGVEIDMWALEKNPNAFVLLQRHNANTWNNKVNLVKSDMRTWKGPMGSPNTKPSTRIYNTEGLSESHHESDASKPDTETSTSSPTLDSTHLLATTDQSNQPTPYKIDILISELLGSFADNELSPECLDGVQHLLNPIHGISIPHSYTAHLTPIAAPKLHADIIHGMTSTTPHAAEIPYVVMFNAIDYLSIESTSDSTPVSPQTQPQATSPTAIHPPMPYSKVHTLSTSSSPAPPTSSQPTPIIKTTWSFQHPNPLLPSPTTLAPIHSTPSISNAHNARTTTLTFPVAHRGTCHGLAGYFETVLYKGVELSTNPNTMDAKSEGMISWFPIYFPLKTPLTVPDNSELEVTMWRRTDDRRVWYEWIVDVFIHQLPPNLGQKSRRRVRVGGSELHSSEKDACLM